MKLETGKLYLISKSNVLEEHPGCKLLCVVEIPTSKVYQEENSNKNYESLSSNTEFLVLPMENNDQNKYKIFQCKKEANKIGYITIIESAKSKEINDKRWRHIKDKMIYFLFEISGENK